MQAVAERHGWRWSPSIKDQGISGAKGRDERPGLDKLLQAVARQGVRHGRSLERRPVGPIADGPCRLLQELHAKHVDCICTSKGSTRLRQPAGRCFR